MRAALSFITLGLALTTCTPLQTGAAPDASACDAPCTLGRTCVAGRCTAAVCVAGRANCDRDESNGCEVSTATNALHCGACGRACALPGATAVCVAGVCRIGACTALRGDCDEDPTNGCETDLATDTAHCGACATSCTRSHATVECSAGACETTACETGFADCDGDRTNGCEADLTTSLAHCGACESPCPAPVHGIALCTARTCASACDTGYERTTGACLSRGAPRLVAPLSANVVSSHRPTLRWALGAATRGAVITLCRDRALTRECQTHSALGTSLQLPSPLARGVWFWNARGHDGAASLPAASLTWSFVVGARDTVATGTPTLPCDLDGDGFDDVVIAASHEDVNRIENAGTVRVFLGSASGLQSTPTRTFGGAQTLDGLGFSTAILGDLDGDGDGDLLAGAPFLVMDEARRPGAVYLWRGGAAGLDTTPTLLQGRAAGYGKVVVSAGDVNGDGFGDALVLGPLREGAASRVSVFWGGLTGIGARPAQVLTEDMATRAAGAFDVNGDGFADVIVGAHESSPSGRTIAGSVRVYRGSAQGLSPLASRTFDGETSGERLGSSVAALGDVNGDGDEDFAFGSDGADGARVVYGSATIESIALTQVIAGDPTGSRVARIGDVNGDGFADLAVGAPGARGGLGRVSVYLGSPAGLAQTPARVWEGDAQNASFGTVIAALGDVNGDGFDDLALGELGATVRSLEAAGRVRVYLGSPSGPRDVPDQVFEGRARFDFFGASIARASQPRSRTMGV
jgi:hypothetical protein